MDKYEYREKTEQIMKYVQTKSYDKAKEIAETIDWKRVKNASMLCTVSEIYEYTGEYQKSREILFIAYDRSPGSRKIVYRLGTLALRLGETEEALDCYEEFVSMAPKDPNQYILKYKILKAQNAPLKEQIRVLEEFKKAEYIEKWAYELAELYDKAGMTTECLEECDDLILWFSDGVFVQKAMELKIKYKPLTPQQQQKYRTPETEEKSQAGKPAAVETAQEEELENFDQKVVSVKCGGCGNHCQLTVNTFADGRKFISGNRCDKPVTGKSEDNSLNLYAYKQQLLAGYKPVAGKRGSIGIPLCLNMYELLPFWYAFWTKLGFAVHTSPVSSRGLYLAGQATIPSDTACFPAKLSHGHIKALTQMHLDAIFYPCLTYNIDEGLGDNHYNCPVVAYYPEVLAGNCPELEGQKFIYDYVGIHRPKDFVHKMAKDVLPKYFGGISEKEVQEAANAAYAEYEAHMAQIRVKGSEIIDEARRQGRRIIVLAGRPYHVDPEINHGIDHLITRHGAAVVTEDSISNRVEKFPTSVLNQWTYHSRLYAAAKYCTTQNDMDLVQLVSFGCGVDAITTDETREILQEGGKLYTQLKIDEITNLGAVNIRLRSLFAALDERDEDKK